MSTMEGVEKKNNTTNHTSGIVETPSQNQSKGKNPAKDSDQKNVNEPHDSITE